MAKMKDIFRSWGEGFESQATEHGFHPTVNREPSKCFKTIGVPYADLSGSGIQDEGRVSEDRRPLGDNHISRCWLR